MFVKHRVSFEVKCPVVSDECCGLSNTLGTGVVGCPDVLSKGEFFDEMSRVRDVDEAGGVG